MRAHEVVYIDHREYGSDNDRHKEKPQAEPVEDAKGLWE